MRLLLALAGAALAHGATAEPGDASLTAGQRRAIAASGLPRAAIVSVKPDMVVAIRSRGTPSAGGGVIEGVVLQGEVVSATAAQVMGYRSMRSTVNVDCVRWRDQVVKMVVYSQPNAKGELVNRQTPGGWVQPSPGAYLSDVMRDICASVPRRLLEEPKPATSAPKSRPTAPVALAATQAPARRAIPQSVLEEDRPLPTAFEARMARPEPEPAPAPAALVMEPAALQPPTKTATAKPPAPKPAPAKPSAPAKPGKVSVQIAASPTAGQAREALAKVKGRLAPPLSTSVRSVTVDGKVFHRALIEGFQSRAEAQAFCARLGGGCFIR